MQAHTGLFAVGVGRAFVVPCGPGGAALGQHRGVGVQHRHVGLIGDGAEHRALSGAGACAQQGQGLVAVAGQDDVVKALAAAVGVHVRTIGVAHDGAHRAVQAFVGDTRGDGIDVVARAAAHRVPLGPVADLDQAVVVAEANHGGHGEGQHLVGRATPNAAHHGQEVPMPKGLAKTFALQKVAQRLHQGAVGAVQALLGHVGAQAVEAHDVGQHAPKLRADQVAALGEHGGEVGAAPLDAALAWLLGHLHRKRHVGRRNVHAQGLEQGQQIRVGAFVEHQKAGVHPKFGHLPLGIGQAHVHGVRVAAKVIARLQQGDVGQVVQTVCS